MAEHDTPIDVRVEHMLTEARVLLPGAQALFGFQLAVLLTDAFGDLPPSSKVLHAVALCCIATSIILLMGQARGDFILQTLVIRQCTNRLFQTAFGRKCDGEHQTAPPANLRAASMRSVLSAQPMALMCPAPSDSIKAS